MVVKITDGNLKKIQKILKKTLKKVYTADGLWCEIDKVVLDNADGEKWFISLNIRYGRETSDGNNNFQEEIVLDVADGNLQFLAGQFYQIVMDRIG